MTSGVLEQVECLDRLCRGLGFDLRRSFRPGYDRQRMDDLLGHHLGSSAGTAVPDEIYEWHGWQSGASDDGDEPWRIHSIGPWFLCPIDLAGGLERYARREPQPIEGASGAARELVVPLVVQTSVDIGYRRSADDLWHLTEWVELGEFWTAPEVPATIGPYAPPLATDVVTLDIWLLTLNDAIEEGRLARVEHNIDVADDWISPFYPWEPTAPSHDEPVPIGFAP